MSILYLLKMNQLKQLNNLVRRIDSFITPSKGQMVLWREEHTEAHTRVMEEMLCQEVEVCEDCGKHVFLAFEDEDGPYIIADCDCCSKLCCRKCLDCHWVAGCPDCHGVDCYAKDKKYMK